LDVEKLKKVEEESRCRADEICQLEEELHQQRGRG